MNTHSPVDGSLLQDVTTESLIERIVNIIHLAEIYSEPSENIYKELIMSLPDLKDLDPIDHPAAIKKDGSVTRYLLDITPSTLSRLGIKNRSFWAYIIKVFNSTEISKAIVSKFQKTLLKRFGSDMPEIAAVPIFYRDLPGYKIGVHADIPTKIATLQFYLPEDNSQMHLGTVFHNRVDRKQLKKNKFIPNSAYAFVRTDESWHSVDILGPLEKPRNSIALTLYIKGHEYISV